ncbi:MULTISPECIES: hypothetical protein [Pseudomonas]|uniref:hypothetical protein n=1 Tax=Pseudomonas TaxID=286 RepID=UPI001BE9145A|nr:MULTISPECIES: hypothetical protein [Pseudomonas]MBT2340056.1 hypothetical protein [Pseudomonas fluorescens]MCD4527932.1 hypothetical protein [Pseudomonas sp. C3-2018]
MDYPKDRPFKGYIIRQHDPAYQLYDNTFQGLDSNKEPITGFCKTAEEVEALIIEYINDESI